MTKFTISPSHHGAARGRNGWFRPTSVWITRVDGLGTVDLSINSRRASRDVAPILLRLPKADMIALASGLLDSLLDSPATVTELAGKIEQPKEAA
jgi:hypothetical protein